MIRARGLAALACAALLGAAGCTTGGTRTTRDGDGWETATTYKCDWKRDGNFLKPGRAPNSPLMPYTRGYWADTGFFFVLLAMPVDLLVSPIAYLTARDCRVEDTQRRYVAAPAENKRKEREDSERARLDREAREAESAKLAALFPPLNESPRPAAVRPDDYALVVGIEGYRSIPKADYGENDAKLVKTYVESLGVPPANVILLTGDRASRADIAKYLEEWLPGVVKPDSRVYFYYSGHGAPDPATGAAYLVPYDGDPRFLKSTAFPLTKIYADLSALPSKESVVMLDSCFSGAGGRSVMAPGVRPLVAVEDSTAAPDRTAVLSASGAREIAGGLDLQKHGLFTYFLLRGLSGEADADRDGHVTLGELNGYLRAKVSETARRDNRDQNPRLLGDASLRMY